MATSTTQKVRKNQLTKTLRQSIQSDKVSIRLARKNKRNLWIIKG